jgi:DNA (cytosine-5)-methyltransferase 1
VVLTTGIDLFSGAGGFSLGALRAGIDIVGALEIHKHAAATYTRNIRRKGRQRVPLIAKDILDTEPKAALRQWGVTTCDIVLGGPPCQGFSSHRILDSGVDDPRNALLGRYFDYVDAIRPRVFLVENVPGLLWERHADYLAAFMKAAKAAGYQLREPTVLNARDYGVPQSRRRVFILGIDTERPLDLTWPPPPTHVPPSMPKQERGERPVWVNASVVFGAAPKGDPNNVHMQHSKELVELFKSTPINGGSRRDSSRVLACHEEYDGHSDVYGRIDPARPGPTMTTACINPSKGRFVHPSQHHGITLRQAARFQTFPDRFVFEGGLMAGGEQIGNAVPVKLAASLLSPIVKAIEKSPNPCLAQKQSKTR